jgi:hypothetical protein
MKFWRAIEAEVKVVLHAVCRQRRTRLEAAAERPWRPPAIARVASFRSI